MTVNAISPNFQVWLFGFVPDLTGQSTGRLTFAEIEAMRSPLEIPGEYIEYLTYTDSVDGGNFTITIPKGNTGTIPGSLGSLRIREILRVGEIIVITERKRIKFCGRIQSTSRSSNITGDQSYTISGAGLEDAIQSQILFIDYDSSGPPIAKRPVGLVANSPTSKISAAFDIIGKAVQASKNPASLIRSLATAAINTLLSNGKYGGKSFAKLVGIKTSPLAYTIGFINTVQWFSNASFGNTLSLWSLMSSVAKQPLYELFYHYDEECHLFISDSSLPISSKRDLGLFNDYTPDSPISNLIFRQTPFDKLEAGLSNPLLGIVSEVSESNFNSFELSENLSEIFTGVHVTLGIQDNVTGLMLNPVTYNPSLVAKLGQRVFQISLDGVGFPKIASNAASQKPFIAMLKTIQDKVYETFGTGERIFSGTFSGYYFRGLCKGQILRIVNDVGFGDLHKELKDYDPNFYVTGIRVTWRPGTGVATQETMVKWGKMNKDPGPSALDGGVSSPISDTAIA